jgi:hypothetical protein
MFRSTRSKTGPRSENIVPPVSSPPDATNQAATTPAAPATGRRGGTRAVIPTEAAMQVSVPMGAVNDSEHAAEPTTLPTTVPQNPKKKKGKKAAKFQPKALSTAQKLLLQVFMNFIRVLTVFKIHFQESTSHADVAVPIPDGM